MMEPTSNDRVGRENEENKTIPPPDLSNVRSDGGAPSLDKDTALELLGDKRRRVVLACLRERQGEDVPLEWLVQQVADAQLIVTGPRGSRAEEMTQRIAVSLHHAQLPKLVAAGVVAYDAAKRTCQYLGDDTLDALLETFDQHETL